MEGGRRQGRHSLLASKKTLRIGRRKTGEDAECVRHHTRVAPRLPGCGCRRQASCGLDLETSVGRAVQHQPGTMRARPKYVHDGWVRHELPDPESGTCLGHWCEHLERVGERHSPEELPLAVARTGVQPFDPIRPPRCAVECERAVGRKQRRQYATAAGTDVYRDIRQQKSACVKQNSPAILRREAGPPDEGGETGQAA